MVDKKSNIDNQFDTDFKPFNIKTDEMRLAEIEKEKIKLGEKFLSEDITQKTEITPYQRVILSLLDSLADKPYKISSTKCNGNKLKNYNLKELKEFLRLFYKLGIPINRKGRLEEVEVLRSLLSSNSQSQSQYPHQPQEEKKLVR